VPQPKDRPPDVRESNIRREDKSGRGEVRVNSGLQSGNGFDGQDVAFGMQGGSVSSKGNYVSLGLQSGNGFDGQDVTFGSQGGSIGSEGKAGEDSYWFVLDIHVLNRRGRRAFLRTLYKRKDRKVHPVNVPLADGAAPGGGINGLNVGAVDFQPTLVPRGSRLTPERLTKMQIGTGFLSKEERQLFVDILFEFEGAVAFEDSEIGLLSAAIEPPVHINTVPHSPWQQQNPKRCKKRPLRS